LIKIIISDALGREIAVLAEGEYPAGYQKVTWKGMDGLGKKVPSGVYFCRLTATGKTGKEFTKVTKMLLMK
jgi:flagellar hook assembly protein FlgD